MTEAQWRLRLAGFAILPALLTLMLLMWMVTTVRLQEVRETFERQSGDMIAQFASSLDYPLMSGQPRLAGHAVDRLLAQPGILFVRIRDARHQVWLARAQPGQVTPSARAFWRVVPVTLQASDSSDWFEADNAASAPLGQVEVLLDEDSIRGREAHLLLQVLQVSLAGMIGLSVVCWLLSGRLARRIQRSMLSGDAAAALDRHWGQLSHGLRTPLSGVSGMLELLSTTPLDDEQRGYLTHARDAADALRQALDRQSDASSETAVPAMLPVQDLRGRRILVVEDDTVSGYLLRQQLRAMGVEADVVATGDEALQLASRRWDLVLLDGQLPDMTAVECWRRWRELSEQAGLPLPLAACVTAYGDAHARQVFLDAGLADVIVKPVTPARLSVLLVQLADVGSGRARP